jgi:hypothetical protein
MCRRIRCERCGRPGFAGCGAHIEQVLGDVPPAQRCQCGSKRELAPAPEGSGQPDSPFMRWWKR